MRNNTVDKLVRDYLREIDLFATSLSPAARSELLAMVTEHLEGARQAGELESVSSTRRVLAALGPPASMVDAEDTPADVAAKANHRLRRSLTWGSFLLLSGWIAGVVQVLSGRRFTPWEKVVVLLAYPGGPLGALVTAVWLGAQTTYYCTSGMASTPTQSGPLAETCSTPDMAPSLAVILALLALFAAWAGPAYVTRKRTP